jgi:hypothetical protein
MSTKQYSKHIAPLAVALVLLAGCASPLMGSLHNASDVQGLAAALAHDGAPQARADAAAALGDLRDPRAVEPLAVAITDAETPVRVAAAGALGKLADKAAAVPLLAAEQDQASDVRDAATQALTTLLKGLSVADAASALADALADQRPAVREAGASALARYVAGDAGRAAAAIGPLLATQVDTTKATEVRQLASQVLTIMLDRLPVAGAVSVLTAATGDARTAAAANSALQQYVVGNSARAPAVVVALLGTQVDTTKAAAVRDAAAQALAALFTALPDTGAVAALTAGLGDATAHDAADAALRQYLAGIGPDRAAAAVVATGAGDAWLAVALGVPAEQLATETRRRGIQLDTSDMISTAAAVAPDGKPVAGAHAYQTSDGFHPATVLLPQGSSTANPFGQGPQQWAPTALRFLELAVVVDAINQQGEQIEVCGPYQAADGSPAPSVTRYRAAQTVRVVSAIDGQPVAQQTFNGADPRACEQTEPLGLTQIVGDPPDLTQAVPWLESLIHPPPVAASGG